MKCPFLISLLFISTFSFCQKDSAAYTAAGKTFQVVEQMPEFPGGEEALMKFIRKNVEYPKKERENDIQGRVVVSFVVNEDGSLSDLVIKKGVSPGIDAEAMRVVKKLPKFKPGMQQGKPVRVQYVLPIMFRLQSDKPLSPDDNAKNETDRINTLVLLRDHYQKVMDVYKQDDAKRESIMKGAKTSELSDDQKAQLKALNETHKANLKAAMGEELYNKWEDAKKARREELKSKDNGGM